MHSADAALKIAHHQFCVLYESNTGKVVSVYETITYEGAGPIPRPKEIESRARQASAKLIAEYTRRPFDQKKVKILMVGPEAFKKEGPKKVDLKQLALVAAKE